MKFTIKTIAFLIMLFALQFNANAQQRFRLPQASSGQTLIQDFGLGKITLTYSRPNVKGRKVFGDLEPFDKVWRTGANSVTVIKFTDAVKFGGKDLPAGEYGLFTIPGKTEWTVILSKNTKQWGSYTYNEAEDVLRVKVKPTVLKDKVETFTMQFANVFQTSGELQLMWDNTAIAVNMTVSVDEKVMASIDEAMKWEKKPYYEAADYYYNNGKDLNKALEWATAAAASQPKAPWMSLLKARIELKKGDKVTAVNTAKAGLAVANEIKNDEYIRLLTKFIDQAK